MSDWHSIDVERAAKELNSDLQKGLTKAEAHRRLELSGYNEIRIEKKGPPEKHVRKELMITNILKKLCKRMSEWFDRKSAIDILQRR
jgi:magnesium-transporting ATPase (P-type)